ncbi:hypothetical protein ROJ8625_02163 [Roseivivax jejudonensis]|uniref:Uncharacterized protein n=1 Tax=Roseivivax jejudonensis TaxID=1529041 RepID=A0A1X6Z8R4_9RHOB|nr:hypothetical protein [Roseivivax jejudonensis]SLN43576.1 hypothetical protein ROJ8625_02163 [Roseivivax jejudonensis]
MFANSTSLTENFRDIRDFILTERAKSVSEREWRFRLRGYGYGLRKIDAGYEVARLPQNTVLGVIEA